MNQRDLNRKNHQQIGITGKRDYENGLGFFFYFISGSQVLLPLILHQYHSIPVLVSGTVPNNIGNINILMKTKVLAKKNLNVLQVSFRPSFHVA